MKARYAYPLVFLLPSVMAAALAAIVTIAAGAGMLWIFVYGDDPWPASAHTVLMAGAFVVFALALAALLAAGYAFGRRREAAGGLRRAHVVAAFAVSAGLCVLVLLHQWQVGHIGG